MKKTLESIPEENVRLKKSRSILSDYALNPEKYPNLKNALEEYEKRIKLMDVRYGGVHDRNCPACGTKYFGRAEVCEICLGVYIHEELFWRQGKIIKSK
jgi:hypothetical protein